MELEEIRKELNNKELLETEQGQIRIGEILTDYRYKNNKRVPLSVFQDTLYLKRVIEVTNELDNLLLTEGVLDMTDEEYTVFKKKVDEKFEIVSNLIHGHGSPDREIYESSIDVYKKQIAIYNKYNFDELSEELQDRYSDMTITMATLGYIKQGKVLT